MTGALLVLGLASAAAMIVYTKSAADGCCRRAMGESMSEKDKAYRADDEVESEFIANKQVAGKDAFAGGSRGRKVAV